MKYIYLFSLAFMLQASLFAQSKVVLGEEEIRKSPYTKFENRSDKFATPEQKALEIEIGKGLHSRVIESNKPINYKGFTLQRFYSDEKGKFGGDILVLNKNASYGHINSIKRILNSYLQSSFEYTEKNADILVMEVLYYNAQNRMKLDRIKKRYTKSLVAALNKNKVGIGKKFSDWPGNTQIVIPIKFGTAPSNQDVSENKSDNKKETTSTNTNPTIEKEKIKPTKAKIPSSEMSKENITTTNKTVEEKKSSKKDEPVIKEEKKNIEIRIQETEKEKSSTISETEVKQPEKTKNSSNSSGNKIPAKTDKPEVIKEKIDEKKSAKEPAKDIKSDSVKDVKEEPKKENKPSTDVSKTIKTNDDKPAKEIVKDDSKKPSEEKPPAKESSKDVKIEEKTVVTKETSKDIKKEEKPVATKDTKPEVPKKESSKSVVINETKKVNTEKPVEQPKKVEEPKKEIPKKETASNPPAKKAEDKIPTSKEEIKKMAKELTELKTKEKDKVENSENVVGEKIVFLKVKEFLAEGHYTSEMWAVDTENDDELFQSPFKKVCGKEFKELGTGVVVMSFKDNDIIKSDTHHLALLDKDNLKLIKQTQEVIFWRSFLKEQSGKIYAVEFKDGKYYLAQFKDDLTFEMRSSDPINPDCEIAFKKNKIYLTKRSPDDSGVSIRVLNRDNLKLRDVKVMK